RDLIGGPFAEPFPEFLTRPGRGELGKIPQPQRLNTPDDTPGPGKPAHQVVLVLLIDQPGDVAFHLRLGVPVKSEPQVGLDGVVMVFDYPPGPGWVQERRVITLAFPAGGSTGRRGPGHGLSRRVVA